MKKMLLFNTVLVLMILVTAGCKKDSNPASPAATGIPAEFVGTWTPQSATVNGAPTSLATVFQFVQGAVSARFVFNANGTFVYSELNATNTVVYSNAGTFSITGQGFSVSVTTENGQPLNPPSSITGTWVMTGNQLVETYQVGGSTVTVTLTK